MWQKKYNFLVTETISHKAAARVPPPSQTHRVSLSGIEVSRFVDVLPRWERFAYFIIGSGSIGYCFYVLYLEGNINWYLLHDADWEDGWNWIGRKQDKTDMEWWLWLKILWTVIPLLSLHIILSQLLFYLRASVKVRLCLLMLCDMVAAVICLGLKPVMLLMCQAVLVYLVTLTGSHFFMWFFVLLLIATFNFQSILKAQIKSLGLDREREFMYIVASTFMYIRMISFSVEKINWRKHNEDHRRNVGNTLYPDGDQDGNSAPIPTENSYSEECNPSYESLHVNKGDLSSNMASQKQPVGIDCNPNLLDMLSYLFYLPLFLDGPIVIYRDFHQQIKKSFKSKVFSVDVLDIFKRLLRLTLWAVFLEFQLHYFYYCAMGLFPRVVRGLSLWAVFAVGYGYAQFFMVKYTCFYGLAMQLMRFDGLEPLPLPRCICCIYSYVDMWKYFDVGLYMVVREHIYIPMGGSRAGWFRQLLASGMAFLFIFWWHGGTLNIFIWCMGNFVTGSLEACVPPMLGQTAIGLKVKSILSPAMQLRVKAICIVPVYIASSLQTLCFFFNTKVTQAFLERIFTRATWSELIAEYFIFMVCIQNAMYFYHRNKAKQHKG